MSKTVIALLGGLLVAATACQSGRADTRTNSAPTSQPQSQKTSFTGPMLGEDAYDLRGAGVHQGPALAATDVAGDAMAYAGKELRLAGTVQSVCKKKGCWMRVGDGATELFVRFQDYGFFVPLDCEGREVVMEGRLNVAVQSVDEQKHYLEDAGKHDEAAKITEPKQVATFMATGVALAKK